MSTPITAEQVYEESVRNLPTAEQLKLAARILNSIPERAVVDYSDSWSDEDLRDITAHSLGRAAASFQEETDVGDAQPR